MSNSEKITRADFVIITPLLEERDAILSQLPAHYKLPPTDSDIRVYYASFIPITLPDGAQSKYSVIIMPLAQMGQTEAATATFDAIRRWTPRYVILTGIAGGVGRNRVSLGDILIAEQVVEYEQAKLMHSGEEIRWRTHEVDQRLLNAAKNYSEREWINLPILRPNVGEPTVHFGAICTGDKVIADERALKKQYAVWAKLIGVEMEAGGSANAIAQTAATMPGFFMVRGVSDLADSQKDTVSVQSWRQYACEIAASFVVNFIRSMPVPIVGLIDNVENDSSQVRLSETLSNQIRKTIEWSSKIDILGMVQPKIMDEVYVSLFMTDDLRAQRICTNYSRRNLTIDEALKLSNQRMVIIGDPGAGKTTTLKKITNRLLKLRKEDYNILPIVIRLRDFRKNDCLLAHLSDIASLAVYNRDRRELPIYWNQDKTDRAAVRLVSKVLSEIGGFLLLDGLDELNPNSRDSLLDEINLLCDLGFNNGVVLTSRSATFVRKPVGFYVFEIEPLQPKQQEEFVNNWFNSSKNRNHTSDDFEIAVTKVPYKDLRTRPLMLVSLCIVFEKYGYLPPQPVTIYRKIVQLLLEEWDGERGVRRYSRYSNFDSARKLDFLAAISYEMDVIRGTGASFSTSNLKEAYREICDRFNLPENDVEIVAAEIESHSGLIIKTGIGTFEFSHKSIQEYLTAEYISRLRILPTLGILLKDYPNELAISVALASDPTEWFCSLFLEEGRHGRLRKINVPIEPFFARMALERPTFGVCKELGFTLLWLISKWNLSNEIKLFCEIVNVANSLNKYFSLCDIYVKNSFEIEESDSLVVFHPKDKADCKFGMFWDIAINRKDTINILNIANINIVGINCESSKVNTF